jgi:hypothetical protein
MTDESPWWGTQFGQLQLAALPNARNIWSLLQAQEPSTVTDRIDVGGMESGEPALFGAQGASWTENQYGLNGLNVTDPYQPGLPLFDPSVDDLVQFQVVIAAKSAADGESGTNIVLGTPQPVPAWHGGARFFYSSGALQSDNFNARLARFHFPGPERLNHLADSSAQLGGKLPAAFAALPFYASFSTQQLDKTLGGFAAPIQARTYRGLLNVTPYSRPSQKLDVLLSGQHVTDSHEDAAQNVAPSATTRANRNFQQFQARWSKSAGSAKVFFASGGLVNAVISSAIQNSIQDVSTLDLPQRILTGSAPLSRSGVRTGYQGQGEAQMLRTGPAGTHSLSLGMDWQRSDISNSWFAIQDLQAITVEGVGAEVIRWNTPARVQQHVQNIAEFVQDLWRRFALAQHLWRPARGYLHRPRPGRRLGSPLDYSAAPLGRSRPVVAARAGSAGQLGAVWSRAAGALPGFRRSRRLGRAGVSLD